ncbi:hypothetical protein Zmor_002241 [Zophobas morio]|uniref:Ig-like domain-containing protein n=1 Tax=Zophobas morio TaxID=2755281 RepID=A0AA38J0K7_9CUCU|nr:hypothetical protein Zmor_002241 [Zophobas morio]
MELLNRKEERIIVQDSKTGIGGREREAEIRVEEVGKQVGKLKTGKAPGRDGLVNEVWIFGTDGMIERLSELMNDVWTGKGFPREWRVGQICPIHKKGSKEKKSLYRKYLRRVCQDCNENLVGWTVTVRNFADNTRGWRASVLSLGPNSAAEIETGLADLGLCGDQGWRLRSGAVDARAPDLSPGEQTKRIKRPAWSFPPGPRLSSGRAPLGPGDGEPGTGNRYFRWSVLSAGVRHFKMASIDGPVLNISGVSRQQMGPYLCIASNGIPPSVSKRIMLIVHFAPMMEIQNQLVGAYEGQQITLECRSEAYPKSINYWTTDKGEIVPQSGKYEPSYSTTGYQIHMKLTIRSIGPQDYRDYKCVSKNSLGDTDGTIHVFGRCVTTGKLKKKTNDVIGELENIADGE